MERESLRTIVTLTLFVLLINICLSFDIQDYTINTNVSSTEKCFHRNISGHWTEIRNSCLTFHRNFVSFYDAKGFCHSKANGILLEIRDPVSEEGASAYINLLVKRGVWIGAQWDVASKKWRWVSDNKTMGPDDFKPWGQRRMVPTQEEQFDACIAREYTFDITATNSQNWSIAPCRAGRHDFICEALTCPPFKFARPGRGNTTTCRPCHCYGEDLCDSGDGRCPSSCERGFSGPTCQIPACPLKTYGIPDCKKICRCLRDVPCNPATGICPGRRCDQDWTGEICDTVVCPQKKYGPEDNCIHDCICPGDKTCSPSTGDCPLYPCTGEWGGPTCKGFECPIGFFSPSSCNKTCYCKDRERCHPRTGACLNGCDLTHSGPTCSEPICPKGYYGPPKCESRCHCKLDADCDVMTGYCKLGCASGYEGLENCDKRSCLSTYYGEKCNKRCHCAEGDCDVLVGMCKGKCMIGFFGPTCSDELQILGTANDKEAKYSLWVAFIVVIAVYILIIAACIIPSNAKKKKVEKKPSDQLETNSATDIVSRILADRENSQVEKKNEEKRQWIQTY